MIAPFILVLVGVLAVLFFIYAARGRSASVRNLSDLSGRTRPVDIAAFRNLVDPREEDYLRERLPAKEFRLVQRERMRAALEYVQCVAGNAAVLLRLGEAARQSEDADVAAAGQELVNHALRVRLYALLAEGRLYVAILLPSVHISPAGVSDSYESLTGMVGRLGRLQRYTQTTRLTATL